MKLSLLKSSPLVVYLLFVTIVSSTAQQNFTIKGLYNPVSTSYLQTDLLKTTPRLVLNPKNETLLKQKMATDPLLQNLFSALKLNAVEIQKQPLLERKQIGRRLLSVSREMLYRINVLGMVYRIEKDSAILERINDEVLSVCKFRDWNPSHFLDVAEMSLAVAFAVDWVGEDLPRSTVNTAKQSLIEKGIKPSFLKNGNNWWINSTNNWNQVCHAGMIAAAIVIAEKDPELAALTISRALDNIPYALLEYGPDGVYPEGSTYWSYGTSFTVLTIAMLESALGQDYGISRYPGFKESAIFRVLSNAPSGAYYNYADCGDKRSKNGDLTLAWFATKIGNPNFFERRRFLQPPSEMGKLPRHAGAAMVWLAQYQEGKASGLPTAWKGEGANPIVVFKPQKNPHGYYLGAKGGRGTVNHGNMDAGSFVFELNGVRWVIDPGNQNYNDLEKTGFNLWGKCQECDRWKLLTKNNYGHSTLTIDGALHKVDGLATLTKFKSGKNPTATFNLAPVFAGQLISAERTFTKDSPQSLIIEDKFELPGNTKMLTWQLITTAAVEMNKGGATLKKNGKELKLKILSHPEMQVSVIMLDPPPMSLDRKIEGLKRIEIRFPAYLFSGKDGLIKVRLSGA